MIIDSHCHATKPPAQVEAFHKAALLDPSTAVPEISDDDLRQSIASHLRQMDERHIDVSLLSPRASSMGHGEADAPFSAVWTQLNNDLIGRIAAFTPDRFKPVCQLPQSTDSTPAQWLPELRRCISAGFVGVNVNPQIAGGVDPATPSLRDPWWNPLWEELLELDIPVLMHASQSHNPARHMNSTHYLDTDFTAVVELCRSDVISRYPGLKIVIPHGGGATWFFYERLRALSVLENWPHFDETIHSLYFDTAVYDEESLELIIRRASADRVLFSSEMFGTAKAVDPTTGRTFDDIIPELQASTAISAGDKEKIFSRNAQALYKL